MTDTHQCSADMPPILIAIDIAKHAHDALIYWPDGKTRAIRFPNSLEGFQYLLNVVSRPGTPVQVAFEPTADYHRNLAYWLHQQGVQCGLVSSLACARAREMLFNSRDKHDRKDARVILYLMQQNRIQVFRDPLVDGTLDVQELSNTYHQISLARTRCQHSLLNHYLTLYFPEMERYFHSSRAQWFCRFLLHYPTPGSITRHRQGTFVKHAWDIVGRKVAKQRFLEKLYELATHSIGLPIDPRGLAVSTFKLQLERYLSLTQQREALEAEAEAEAEADQHLSACVDYTRLRSLPGVGPINALMILAESGNLKRFGHYRQYLNFCGFNLSAHQSGQRQSGYRLSKHGNARLRYAYWLAAVSAIRQRENSFRYKYERYIRKDPDNADLRRKARVAVACKMARVAHALIKQETNYRGYHEYGHGT